jgi:hypothetical protein
MSSTTRAQVLVLSGWLLVVLGGVHLVATPFIAAMVRDNARPESAEWLTKPMLLNHILVGILLVSLGGLTAYAGRPAAAGERWAQVIVRVSALTVATFLPLLFFVMGFKYVAPLFVLAAAIVFAVTALLLGAAFGGGSSPR